MRRQTLSTTLLLVVLVAPCALEAQRSSAEILEAARYEQEVRGDLSAAERLYRSVLDAFPADRPAHARALVELGSVYELSGNEQAEAAYRRVIADFPDQSEAVARARSRLAAIVPESPAASPSGIVVRQIWSTREGFDVGSISPDGREVAFVDWTGQTEGLRGYADLAIYDTRTGRARLVTDRPPQTEIDTYIESAVWSSDGRWLAYVVWDTTWLHQKLRIVRSNGSEDRVLIANDQLPNIRPMSWSPRGDFIVAVASGWDDVARIVVVSTKDGSVQTLKTLGTHMPWPLSISPDGRFVTYDYLQEEGSTSHDIFILAIDGSREERVLAGPADDDRPFFTPDGGWIVFRSDRSGRRGLWAIPVADGRAVGEPELVRPDLAPAIPLGLTNDGTLYTRIPVRLRDVQTARLDAGGTGSLTEVQPLSDAFVGTNSNPSWDPVGARVAYLSRRGPGGAGPGHLVIRSMADGAETAFPLPFPIRDGDSRPVWSADGKHILIEGGTIGETTADPRLLISYSVDVETGQSSREPFARDVVGFSNGIAFFATPRQSERLRDVGVRLIGHRALEVFSGGDEPLRPEEEVLWVRNGVSRMTWTAEPSREPITPLGHSHAWSLSPDGSTIAVALPDDPERQVSNVLWLLSIEDRVPREAVRVPGDEEITAIRWLPGSEDLLFTVTANDDNTSHLWRLSVGGGDAESLDIPLDPAALAELDFHPDGRRVVYTTTRSWNELWSMQGLPWQQ
ncbi:MAG: hypothetical protein WD766_11645 [Gemmatimonadota bacterium]